MDALSRVQNTELLTDSPSLPESETDFHFLKEVLGGIKNPYKTYARKIELIESQGALLNMKQDIISSILHMHCNRLLGFIEDDEQKTRVFTAYLLEKLCAKQMTSI